MNRVKTIVRGVFWLLLLFIFTPGLWAQSSFAQGEALFMQNKPQEALAFLESAVSEDPIHVQAHIYLGIAYTQVNRLDDAIRTYMTILPRGGSETARIAFNLGNIHFAKGEYAIALQFYNQAVEINPSYASAYLNRANTQVRSSDLTGALNDYHQYLALEPGSRQADQIIRLMALIREEFAAEEQRRVMAEEAARAEAERRRRLLEEVAESLHAAAGDARSLSAGTEDVLEFESEFELE